MDLRFTSRIGASQIYANPTQNETAQATIDSPEQAEVIVFTIDSPELDPTQAHGKQGTQVYAPEPALNLNSDIDSLELDPTQVRGNHTQVYTHRGQQVTHVFAPTQPIDTKHALPK